MWQNTWKKWKKLLKEPGHVENTHVLPWTFFHIGMEETWKKLLPQLGSAADIRRKTLKKCLEMALYYLFLYLDFCVCLLLDVISLIFENLSQVNSIIFMLDKILYNI